LFLFSNACSHGGGAQPRNGESTMQSHYWGGIHWLDCGEPDTFHTQIPRSIRLIHLTLLNSLLVSISTAPVDIVTRPRYTENNHAPRLASSLLRRPVSACRYGGPDFLRQKRESWGTKAETRYLGSGISIGLRLDDRRSFRGWSAVAGHCAGCAHMDGARSRADRDRHVL